ncbi:hypothetical protein PG985_007779 [Apiospora marii]|uniref:Uncharacterized protein n=1 Tax=Apiospora marii TaxID=335849 RepID=A0ABR1SRW1_9PEZI
MTPAVTANQLLGAVLGVIVQVRYLVALRLADVVGVDVAVVQVAPDGGVGPVGVGALEAVGPGLAVDAAAAGLGVGGTQQQAAAEAFAPVGALGRRRRLSGCYLGRGRLDRGGGRDSEEAGEDGEELHVWWLCGGRRYMFGNGGDLGKQGAVALNSMCGACLDLLSKHIHGSHMRSGISIRGPPDQAGEVMVHRSGSSYAHIFHMAYAAAATLVSYGRVAYLKA